jgi:predicted restriction endonuclease
VIRQDTLGPGKGYFDVYGKDELDFGWWEDQIASSKRFDWRPYLDFVPPPPSATPLASDLSQPNRVDTKISRILRDTQLSRSIKQKHKFCCQLCGETILLANGERYAEAHHIRPLGSPHDGPDIEGNIICVCPNHHVELDYFARLLEFDQIRTVADHDLDQIFLDYHNQHHERLRR